MTKQEPPTPLEERQMKEHLLGGYVEPVNNGEARLYAGPAYVAIFDLIRSAGEERTLAFREYMASERSRKQFATRAASASDRMRSANDRMQRARGAFDALRGPQTPFDTHDLEDH